METILAILLYMHLIVSPGSYLKTEIDMMATKNKVEINRIESDPAKMDLIHKEYDDDVVHITIIDDSHTGLIKDTDKENNTNKNKPDRKTETKQTEPNTGSHEESESDA